MKKRSQISKLAGRGRVAENIRPRRGPQTLSQRQRRLERQVQVTAHHEAGHAVMAEFLSVPYKSVSIVPTPEDRGRVSLTRRRWPATPDPFDAKLRGRIEDTVMVLMAGYIAERDFTGRGNNAGARSDQAATWELVETIAFSEVEQAHHLETLFARCAFLMRNAVIRRSVRVLARALVASGELERAEAAAVVAAVVEKGSARATKR